MEEFIAYLVKNLVDQPENVQVHRIDREEGMVLEIKVSATDVGKVVGRQGRTIKALRTLAQTVGARLGHRVRVEVIG